MQLDNKRRAKLMVGPYTRLLAEHEMVISSLYNTFASVLKSADLFWRAMADEELSHKKLILEVEEKLYNGEWRFKRPNFVTYAVSESIAWVAAHEADVARNGISMRNALKLALNLESGMIERKFLDVVDGDTPEMMNTLESLSAYSRGHVKRLQMEAIRLKWRILGYRKTTPKVQKGSKAPVSREGLMTSVKTSQADMIGRLIALEEAVSSLYNIFSRRLPDSREFWSTIAAEEMQHATMLRVCNEIT